MTTIINLAISAAVVACLAPGFAAASSYQYATFNVALNPAGDVFVTGLDAVGDVVAEIQSTGKHGVSYAFSYVGGSVQLATPVGGKFFSTSKGVSSNGIAIIYKYPVGKKHQTPLKWDVVADKLSPLYSKKPTSYFYAQFINRDGDLAGECSSGACLLSGGKLSVMTENARDEIAAPCGLNDTGFSAGTYDTLQGNALFTYVNGTETDYTSPPSGSFGYCNAVASNGVVAGVGGPSGSSFVLDNGSFTSYSYPNATYTIIYSINSTGQFVGVFNDADGTHAFLYENGNSYIITVSGASAVYPYFINDSGTIAGSYTPTNGKHALGFIATCAGGAGTCTP